MIWLYALGYFASYVPYSTLVKASTDGLLMDGVKIDGTAVLPIAALSSMVFMVATISLLRWWRFAGRRSVAGVSIPWPGPYTFFSGLCTGVVVVSTTLAYTFEGVSIVLMMLLLRGGVLVLAPIVDSISGRRVRWFSWAALSLSLSSLVVAFYARRGFDISAAAGVNVAAYLAAYFVRLRFMSRIAKAEDPNASRRYFVEEQMIATPSAVLGLGLIALLGSGPAAMHLREGFAMLGGHELLGVLLVIGFFSQGTGVFGGLVLLDKRENSFCVPVNRCSSMLAGLCATLALGVIWNAKAPHHSEYWAAGLVIAAIAVLSVPGVLAARRRSIAAR